jgi:hypothetical protein
MIRPATEPDAAKPPATSGEAKTEDLAEMVGSNPLDKQSSRMLIGCATGALAGTVGAWASGLSGRQGVLDAGIGCLAGAVSAYPDSRIVGKTMAIFIGAAASGAGNLASQLVANGGHLGQVSPAAIMTNAFFGGGTNGLGVWADPFLGAGETDGLTGTVGTIQSAYCGTMARADPSWTWC